MTTRPWLILAAWACAGAASGAESCESLRAQIEAKIAAAGVARFTVSTLEVTAPADGQVVGSCELGTRKIVYQREGGPGAERRCAGFARRADADGMQGRLRVGRRRLQALI